MPSREDALNAVRTLLGYIGDDPDRQGLLKTPERVVAAWEAEWGAGYHDPEFQLTKFDNEVPPDTVAVSVDQMVFMRDISFVSHCEHHMAPFYGVAHVAYLPRDKIVGLSKLARIVLHFSARLQVQERMTAEIASFISKHISPDCAIMISAEHMCMISRGVKQPHSKTITTALRGKFRMEPEAQSEFLAQARSR